MTRKLTKSQSKYIKSLQQKKYRDVNKHFVVEGVKLVEECLQHPNKVDFIAYVGDKQDYNFDIPESAYQTSNKELSMISSLKTPNKILGVCHQSMSSGKMDYGKPILALDEISDPGNLGTILRLADWFGIEQIVCAPGSVDIYNPKVIQATMGSIFRVNVHTYPIETIIEAAPANMEIIVADMAGENLYTKNVQSPYLLVMGSEGHGVSNQIAKLATSVVSIPKFGGGESLNVAVSTGIILSEFCRKLG